MSTNPQSSVLYQPTNDEKTFALLAYVLGIFAGFLAPLIFFLIKRDSKFVAFHALQSLAWHVLYVVLMILGMAAFFIAVIAQIGTAHDAKNGPPMAFFGMFAFVWLAAMGGWVVNLVMGVVYGIRANKGEWAEFPLVGRWILKNIVNN